jgi:hypothetical protein
LAVSITCVTPAAFSDRIHWAVSTAGGAKTDSFSAPEPHSRSVKVFIPKWVNAVTGRCCQASCPGRGTTAAALATTRSGLSQARTAMMLAGRIGPPQASSAEAAGATVNVPETTAAARTRPRNVMTLLVTDRGHELGGGDRGGRSPD